MTMTVDVESIKTLVVEPNETLVVTVDVTMMNDSEANGYMKSVKEFFCNGFPKNRVAVVPNNLALSKIEVKSRKKTA